MASIVMAISWPVLQLYQKQTPYLLFFTEFYEGNSFLKGISGLAASKI